MKTKESTEAIYFFDKNFYKIIIKTAAAFKILTGEVEKHQIKIYQKNSSKNASEKFVKKFVKKKQSSKADESRILREF